MFYGQTCLDSHEVNTLTGFHIAEQSFQSFDWMFSKYFSPFSTSTSICNIWHFNAVSPWTDWTKQKSVLSRKKTVLDWKLRPKWNIIFLCVYKHMVPFWPQFSVSDWLFLERTDFCAVQSVHGLTAFKCQMLRRLVEVEKGLKNFGNIQSKDWKLCSARWNPVQKYKAGFPCPWNACKCSISWILGNYSLFCCLWLIGSTRNSCFVCSPLERQQSTCEHVWLLLWTQFKMLLSIEKNLSHE